MASRPESRQRSSRPESRSHESFSSEKEDAHAPVDEDLGLWDVERCAKHGGFDFADDGHTALLKGEAIGQWCAVVGERHFENGVHGFAMRVCYNGSSLCPSSELDNGWLVGVGPKGAPLEIGAGVEEDEENVWANGHPTGYGNRWYLGVANASGNQGRVVVHPASALKPGHIASAFHGRIFHGDVIGVKVEVEHGRVSFFVNGSKRKEVAVHAPSAAWVPWVCSCTPRVKFTLLSKEEQQAQKVWGAAEWKEMETAGEHGAVQTGQERRRKEEERLRTLLLSGEEVNEVLELLIGGVELEEGWFRGLELEEVSVAADTLKQLLLMQLPIAPGALKEVGKVGSAHPIVVEDMRSAERRSTAKDFLREAQRGLQARKREVEAAASALQGLRAGEEAYEEEVAMDMSLALGTQDEERRLMGVLAAAQTRLGEAEREREERERRYGAAKGKAAETNATLAALHLRCVNLLYRMYLPLIGHLGDNTVAAPTFSAPDATAAAAARRRKDRGMAVGANEMIPAKVDEATGNVTVTAACATPSARIFYSIDGSNPHEDTSPSVASGRKVVLSGSTRLLAFAVAPNMRPSAVVSSPQFVVACSPPVFVGQSVGAEKIRVQLRSGTSGQVKVYYAFNSRDSTPHEVALEGGNPKKEPPYGDGRGRRDGSQPLRDEATGEVKLNAHCAGVINNFDSIDVVTSGHLLAFASKPGLADSPLVRSNMYTIAGK